nr:hypothetical protein [Tanacetum cinerariifolium]
GCLDSGLSTNKLSGKAASELIHGVLNLSGSQGFLDSGLSTNKLSGKAASELIHGVLNLSGS